MIRLIIGLIYTLLSVVLLFPYHIYLWFVSKKDRYKGWYKSWKFVGRFFKGLIKIAGTKVEVRGAENLAKVPNKKGILFIGNHRSFFDIIIMQTVVDRPTGFIAKSDFKKIPLFKHWVTDIGAIFLDRKNVRAGLETMNQGAEYMKQGHSMILFPEGHRNQTDEFLPFKEGGYKMADKSGCPIVPFAISGTDLIYESAPGKNFKSAIDHIVLLGFLQIPEFLVHLCYLHYP